MGVARKKRAGHMDELAAVMILKSYLDANKPVVE
jgi:RNase H-fold protein (predicted Holliday junction resolvase)